jgi:hypothetical protein
MVSQEKIFIQKCKIVHDNIYDYSKTAYKNSTSKIIITCNIHGDFSQLPPKHLFGQGCPKCSKFRKKTPLEFEEKAKKIHSNRYDYSKTDFTHIKNRSVIICPIHGEFLQTIDKHINFGRGCQICGGSKKKTQEEWLSEAKSIHGDLYDYSLSIYTNFESKLTILCKRHGAFDQTPHNHIKGKQGCPHCVHRISKGETEWLNYIGLPNDSKHRNVYIKLSNRSIKADGFNPITNTVYEYYGDYYHGNPVFFDGEKNNPHTKCTFGELYNKTLEKERIIIENGYKLITIWESNWRKQNEKL